LGDLSLLLNGEDCEINGGEDSKPCRRDAKEIANHTKPPQAKLCLRVCAKSEEIRRGFWSSDKKSAQQKYSYEAYRRQQK
jgi:hypothetical protein